jgi:hypothetical protein
MKYYITSRLLLALLGLVLASFLLSWPFLGLTKAAATAGIIATLIALLSSALRLTHYAIPPSTPDQLDQAFRALSEEIRTVWEAEARFRGLERPPPARFVWGSARRPVASSIIESARHILRHSDMTMTSADYMKLLASEYRKIPEPRVIVTAEAGGGKSAFAVLLTLGLLKNPPNDTSTSRVHARIPILASVGSWDPVRDSLDTWLSHWIRNTYRSLSSPEYGGTAIDGLISTDRLLPILDGLDELPANTWTNAVQRLASLPTGRPLVLTCRRNYEEIVQKLAESDGAYVIELERISAPKAADWLQAACDANSEELATWQPVLTSLRRNNDPILAESLQLPLYMQLARVVFRGQPGGRNPTSLLDRVEFPTAEKIRGYLLRNFTRSAFAKQYPDVTLSHPSGSARLKTLAWDPEKAESWLGFAAAKLKSYETQNIAWWRMHRAVRDEVFGAVMGVIAATAYALTRELPEGLTKGFAVGVTVGIAIGLSRGLNSSTFAVMPLGFPRPGGWPGFLRVSAGQDEMTEIWRR